MPTLRLVLVGSWSIFTFACSGQSSGDDAGRSSSGPDRGGDETRDERTPPPETNSTPGVSSSGSDSIQAQPPSVSAHPGTPPISSQTPPLVRPPTAEPGTDPDGTGECSEYAGGSDTYCSYERHCPTDYLVNSCSLLDGKWQCNCRTSQHAFTIELSDFDGDTACDATVDLCRSGKAGTDTDTTGPEQCKELYDLADRNVCNLGRECLRSVSLEDGTTASVSYIQNTHCNLVGGEWDCTCSSGIGFRAGPEGSSSAVCAGALEVCERLDAGIEFDGPVECELDSYHSYPEACDRTDHCRQSTQVDGVELFLSGFISLGCYDQGNGQYNCDCSYYSGNQFTDFRLDSRSSSRETCDAAMVRCQDAFDVQAGLGKPL